MLRTTTHADFGAQQFAPRRGVPVVLENSLGCAPLKASVDGGAVAIMRGSCKFWEKALYAELSGAEFCIIYASESTPGPSDFKAMVCKEPGCDAVTIPVLYFDGQALKSALEDAGSLLSINLGCDSNGTATTTAKRQRVCEATTTTTTTTTTDTSTTTTT